MSIARPLAALALASLCATPYAADDGASSAGAVLEEETRVYLGPCVFAAPAASASAPTGGPPKPIAPFLVAAAAEAVVDFAAGALKAAGEDQSTQAIAAYPANGWMYQMDTHARLGIHPQARCVQIVSGSFWNGLAMHGSETAASAPARDEASTIAIDAREKTTVDQVNLAHWKQPPDFPAQFGQRYRQLRSLRLFFEARLAPFAGSSDKFTLAPQALYFAKPVQRGWLEWSTPKRNLLVSVTLSTAGSSDGKGFASVSFPFREVPGGTLLTPLYFMGHESRAIQVPALTDDEKGTLTQARTLFGTATAEVTLAKGSPPPPSFVAADPLANEKYLKAARAYCDALGDANRQQAFDNKRATPVTAAECPVDVLTTKASLDKLRAALDKTAAKTKADDDTLNIWTKPDNDSGVLCKPSLTTTKGVTLVTPHCELADTADLRPITASASVVEIKEGNKFAAFLGKVLEKAQPAINSAIAAAAPASQAAVAEQGKQNQGSYQLAVADVAVAQAELDAANAVQPPVAKDIAQAQRDLLGKKVAANQVARLAGLPEHYPIP